MDDDSSDSGESEYSGLESETDDTTEDDDLDSVSDMLKKVNKIISFILKFLGRKLVGTHTQAIIDSKDKSS